ncbi:MAG: hypothetical protein HZC41_17800 [Chloroflexi bacterium]|nr:hypothetical protein [Chloroflexota bacterium]
MRFYPITASFILLTLLTLTPIHIHAQETTPSSISDIKAVKISQPFTQADLSVITANTQRPNGMTWHNNKLYTVCSGDWTVYEIDSTNGETAQYIYGVRNAHSLLASDSNEGIQLLIPDFQTDSLIRIQRGVTENIATGLNGPWGITSLNPETLIVTNLKANNAVAISGNETSEIITNLRSPTGIAVNSQYLFIANTGSARRAIEWFDLSQLPSGERDTPLKADEEGKPLVSGLQNTTGITLGPDGLLYFAYALGTRGIVGRVDPEVCINNGGCSNDQIETVVFTELPVPLAGLTVSPDMRLFVHSMYSPELYWLQLPTE